MERLTYFKNGHWRLNFDGCQYNAEFVDRLAAYENTGLMPEAVEQLKLASMGKSIAEITEFDGILIDRLRELAEADKDGRVMVFPGLPCKIGDTVWCVTRIGIRELVITSFERNRYGDYAVSYGAAFRIEDFGKNVFLTREEAEAKLKEVQEDD